MSGSNIPITEDRVGSADGNGDGVQIVDLPSTERRGQGADDQRDSHDGESDLPRKSSRRGWLWALSAALVVGTGVGISYYLYARVYVTTDDAFIEGHVVPVSARVAGHVAKMYVTDNQWVNKGDLVLELDPRDLEASLAAAEAELRAARAVAESRSISVEVTQITSSAGVDESSASLEASKAGVETARAAVTTAASQQTQAEALLASAEAALKEAETDVQAADARHDAALTHLKRVEELAPRHAVSEESLDEARAAERVAQADAAAAREKVRAAGAAVKQAEAAVAAAQSSLSEAEARVSASQAGQTRAAAQLTSANSAPKQVAQSQAQRSVAEAEVDRAKAKVDQAQLNLSYTKIYAPASGHVTRKSIEPGSYVQVGQPLFALVEPEVWVIANFKETQLTRMRPGQPATVEVDTYPGEEFAAHVDSIQRGAGARFSLLPPENATGNFVKVVQRVPVKIVFDDPGQLERYTLGPGMSAVPTVNVRSKEMAAAAESVVRSH